ncbi:MAG TPA: DNA polymerase III subunit gamma/tau [Amoebophilaceae bacterium]|nr:DNA polymerase III subunit gamma/tau [Amoebophilaceae bacterium]
MSQFVVSARKYRPISFKDVVSQAHITTTLQNALANKQLAHSFLFCGPRGVGKTTCARILAKAINCLGLTETIEPCNSCAHCISFQTNSSMNVYELDAASNNSVEDIRELVDQVRYAPQLGKYKVYIIDEVHMLSNAAFNAFLKTLEEPPSYALFILATTERNKVLPTIVSRCQTFHFNRIKIENIVDQLQTIATQEAIACELPALQLIAQQAEGAMRDALSMFDLIHTSVGIGNTVTYALARDHLNLLDEACYFQATDAFLQGNVAAVLTLLDSILRQGFNGHAFVVGLGEHLRNILVCKDPVTIPLLEVTDNLRPNYAAYAAQCSLPFLLESLTRIQQCDATYKASQNQRLHVELLLIDLATKHISVTTHTNQTNGATAISPSAATTPTTTATIQTKELEPSAPSLGKQVTAVVPTLEAIRASLSKKEPQADPAVKKKI